MTLPRTVLILSAFALLAAACASTGETAAPALQAEETDEAGPGSLLRAQTITATATVEDVDHETRMVTLRGPEDRIIRFRAGEQVRNLDQIEKGDLVEAVYHESVAVQVRKPGEATPGVSAGETIHRAKPGEQPGAMGIGTVVVTTTIEAIDPERRSVTLKDTDGSLLTVPVRDPANLEGVAVGDLVEITYTEAVGIAVEKPR